MFHGDVNLSCTMTFLSTLGSFAFTSLWVYLLGRQVLVRSSTRVSNTLFTFVNNSLAHWRLDWSPYHNVISLLRPMIGKDIPIPYMNIAMSLVSFTVPLLLGVAFKRKWPKKALILSKKVFFFFKKSNSSAHLGLTPTAELQLSSKKSHLRSETTLSFQYYDLKVSRPFFFVVLIILPCTATWWSL